jgi:hypothetical protein
MQGSVPFRNKNNESEDAIERIVQKAFAPIAETLQKIMEKGERAPNTFNSRPNYNNNNRGQSYNGNRGQNFRSYNNSSNCYACGQTGHIAWNCPTRQGNQRNQMNPTIPSVPRPTNTVPPQANTMPNQTVQQASQGDVNHNTFITQEDEIQQPVTTVWEGLQHLN